MWCSIWVPLFAKVCIHFSERGLYRYVLEMLAVLRFISLRTLGKAGKKPSARSILHVADNAISFVIGKVTSDLFLPIPIQWKKNKGLSLVMKLSGLLQQ